jgi:hypothetical protein
LGCAMKVDCVRQKIAGGNKGNRECHKKESGHAGMWPDKRLACDRIVASGLEDESKWCWSTT